MNCPCLQVNKSEPLWRFGYGLSYSRFRYSNLTIGTVDEHDVGRTYVVTATVANIGHVVASEVAQLYVSNPNASPPHIAALHCCIPLYNIARFKFFKIAPTRFYVLFETCFAS